jgi:hypothetical protein
MAPHRTFGMWVLETPWRLARDSGRLPEGSRLRHTETGEMIETLEVHRPAKGFPYFLLAGGRMLQAWDLGWRP